MTEQWRPVVGWEALYEVSDLGRVRSAARVVERSGAAPMTVRARVRKLNPRPSGHLTVGLYRGGRGLSRDVHTIVLEAFVGPRPAGMEACHTNGDPTDNRLENLRWDTRSENNRDRVRHGSHNNTQKTHCPSGHEYSAENTYRIPSDPTRRYCRICMAKHRSDHYDRKRVERSKRAS